MGGREEMQGYLDENHPLPLLHPPFLAAVLGLVSETVFSDPHCWRCGLRTAQGYLEWHSPCWQAPCLPGCLMKAKCCGSWLFGQRHCLLSYFQLQQKSFFPHSPPRAFLKPDLGFPVPLPAVAPSCILLATAVCSYERDGAPVQHDFAGSSFTLCWFLLHPFGAL